jgi:hypothetical protein
VFSQVFGFNRSFYAGQRHVVSKLFLLWTALSLTAPFLAKFFPGTVLVEVGMVCFVSNVWILFLCGVLNVVNKVRT